MLHPTLGWGEQKGLGIDAMHLAINSFHTATGEINQSLCFSVVCAAGIEHNSLVASHRLLGPASPQTVRMLMLPLAWFDPGSADGTFLLHS